MFTCADRLETDKGDLHACEGTDRVPGGVCDVEPARVTTHEKENECVERDHVGDEDITTYKDLGSISRGASMKKMDTNPMRPPCKSRIRRRQHQRMRYPA